MSRLLMWIVSVCVVFLMAWFLVGVLETLMASTCMARLLTGASECKTTAKH